jgi:hypothetical protein
VKTPNEILIELEEIVPYLAKYGISNVPYRVPDGFFEDFVDNLMKRIQINAVDYSEPDAGQQNAEVSTLLEISEISPLLAGLRNKNPYQVPAGYFEGLTSILPAKVAQPIASKQKAAPVLSIKFFKYAMAACIVALLGTAIFNLTYHRTTDPIKDLTNVSDQDMANYLDSDDIHWTPGISSSSVSADFNENDVQDLLSGIPDEELEEYSTLLPDDKRNVN